VSEFLTSSSAWGQFYQWNFFNGLITTLGLGIARQFTGNGLLMIPIWLVAIHFED
jgi:hypothetical protein